MITAITPQQLRDLMQGPVPHAVIDVRERGEFNKRQIFGSTSLPRKDLEFEMSRLVPVKHLRTVLCDDDDGRAELAAATLGRMGYLDVAVLTGGLPAWSRAGYELVEGTNTPSKDFGEKVLVQKRVPEVTIAEYRERVARGERFILVDTRTPEEFQRATLPGSRNVPNGELALRITDVIGDSEAPIVVHCGGRTRSIIGTQILREMGVDNPVVGLQNGTMGWLLAGHDLEVGSAAAPLRAPTAGGQDAAESFADRLASEHRIRYLSTDELQDMISRREKDPLYLVDVRTREEYARGHIPGFAWFPGGQVIQRTDEVVAVRSARIVLCCDGRARATVVARWLREMGFPNACVLDGGVTAWTSQGLPFERGEPGVSPFGLDEARASAHYVEPSEVMRGSGRRADYLIVDVETSRSYAGGHVPGAIWIPRGWLERRVPEYANDRNTPIVLTSRNGDLATLAAGSLQDMGYGRVSVLRGGTLGWAEVGLPLESGMGAESRQPDDVVVHPLGDRERMEYYLTWEEGLGRKHEQWG